MTVCDRKMCFHFSSVPEICQHFTIKHFSGALLPNIGGHDAKFWLVVMNLLSFMDAGAVWYPWFSSSSRAFISESESPLSRSGNLWVSWFLCVHSGGFMWGLAGELTSSHRLWSTSLCFCWHRGCGSFFPVAQIMFSVMKVTTVSQWAEFKGESFSLTAQ